MLLLLSKNTCWWETMGRIARGYVIESQDGNVHLSLPSLVECDDTPNNRNEKMKFHHPVHVFPENHDLSYPEMDMWPQPCTLCSEVRCLYCRTLALKAIHTTTEGAQISLSPTTMVFYVQEKSCGISGGISSLPTCNTITWQTYLKTDHLGCVGCVQTNQIRQPSFSLYSTFLPESNRWRAPLYCPHCFPANHATHLVSAHQVMQTNFFTGSQFLFNQNQIPPESTYDVIDSFSNTDMWSQASAFWKLQLVPSTG